MPYLDHFTIQETKTLKQRAMIYTTVDEVVVHMFYRCFFCLFFLFFFPSVKKYETTFSGTAERIFMKHLPNDSGENVVCIAIPKWGLGPQ